MDKNMLNGTRKKVLMSVVLSGIVCISNMQADVSIQQVQARTSRVTQNNSELKSGSLVYAWASAPITNIRNGWANKDAYLMAKGTAQLCAVGLCAYAITILGSKFLNGDMGVGQGIQGGGQVPGAQVNNTASVVQPGDVIRNDNQVPAVAPDNPAPGVQPVGVVPNVVPNNSVPAVQAGDVVPMDVVERAFAINGLVVRMGNLVLESDWNVQVRLVFERAINSAHNEARRLYQGAARGQLGVDRVQLLEIFTGALNSMTISLEEQVQELRARGEVRWEIHWEGEFETMTGEAYMQQAINLGVEVLRDELQRLIDMNRPGADQLDAVQLAERFRVALQAAHDATEHSVREHLGHV